MPANSNTISFGPGQASNADLQAQQLQLQRQQKIAEMLRQQALTPEGTQVVSGVAVKNSPLLGAAQLAKAFLANKIDGDNDTKQASIGATASARAAAALRSLAPPGTFDEPAATPALAMPGSPAQPGMPADPNAAAPQGMPAAQAPQQPAVDPSTKAAWARALGAYQMDPELGRSMVQSLSNPTEEQKNLQAQGIDPRAYGSARLAGEQAKALVNVAPNNTVFNAATNKPVYAGADFANGRSNGFDANGAPTISRAAGSELIPQQAGDVERAKAAGSAGYNLITVNTPNGPVMMTAEQAAKASGGQQPAGAPVDFTASNGVHLDFQKTPPQQLFDMAQKSGDPQLQQALSEWSQSSQRSAPGIALQTPADAARQVGQVQNDLALNKERLGAAQSQENQQKITDAGSVIGLLDQAEPLLNSGTPTASMGGALRDKVTGAIGMSTDSSRASAQLAAIGGALISKQPKMSGPQSDKDVLLYREMAGRIGDPTVPLGDRLAALKTVKGINQRYIDQNQNSVANQALKQNMGAPAAGPSIDDLLKKYGGK